MTRIKLSRCTIDGVYRLLCALENADMNITYLAPAFGHSRRQARKYVELALGLRLIRPVLHPLRSDLRKRAGRFGRYYTIERRGRRVLDWIRQAETIKLPRAKFAY